MIPHFVFLRLDGSTMYINASTATLRYQMDNLPIVFDLPRKSPLLANAQPKYENGKEELSIPNVNAQTGTEVTKQPQNPDKTKKGVLYNIIV